MSTGLRFRTVAALVLALTVLFVSTSCGPSEKSEVVYLQQATSQMGGTWFVFGGAVGSVMDKYAPGLSVSPIPTTGNFENLELLRDGKVELAQFLPSAPYQAYNATGQFEGQEPYTDLRVLIPFYGSPHHYIVPENSPIQSLHDLQGKRVGSGPPGSEDFLLTDILLNGYGYNQQTDLTLSQLGREDRTEALGDGQIDIAFVYVGMGSAAIMELANTHNVRFLSVDEDVLDEITAAHPYVRRGVIPAGTYRGQDGDVVVLWEDSFIGTNADLDEDVAYEYVKAYWEHFDEIVSAYAGAAIVPLETAFEGGTFGIPVHPGALRYYEERGITIPGQ